MTFQLETSNRLFALHGTIGLTDWGLDKELKLTTTTDQLHHGDGHGLLHGKRRNDPFMGYVSAADYRDDDQVFYDGTSDEKPDGPFRSYMASAADSREDERVFYDDTTGIFVTPSPWLLVNPNIIFPSQNRENPADLQLLCGPAEETPLLEAAETQPSQLDDLQEELLCPLTSAPEYMIQSTICPPLDDENPNLECWPRPPVTYSILIALALKSSLSGSLKVQQIYSFTRQHFPFFQTAPDGWKNAIRHNLCFNNNFHKTNQLYGDGKRKSCFWHLTPDGHRWLTDEIRILTGESLKQLERSMAHPDVIQSLLAL